MLPPGTLVPIHPVAFLVITTAQGLRPAGLARSRRASARHGGADARRGVRPRRPSSSRSCVIAPACGAATTWSASSPTLEGEPLPVGDIASRLGGFDDIAALEATEDTVDSQIIETLLGSKNTLHNNYQDFQAFLDAGGKIGLQHDPLLYGAYLLNPFLVRVEMVPMLVVKQGEVAVDQGLRRPADAGHLGRGVQVRLDRAARPSRHLAGAAAHRQVRDQPALLRGRDRADGHPDAQLGRGGVEAHNLDAQLVADRGQEPGRLRLQHRPAGADPRARHAGAARDLDGRHDANLVNEVLQAAVGNHFRDKLQSIEPVRVHRDPRSRCSRARSKHIRAHLNAVRGGDARRLHPGREFPEELVKVLTQREIANQEKATFREQQRAQMARVDMEKAKGTADMQAELAASPVGVDIKRNDAQAREAEGAGEAAYVEQTGRAEATKTEAIGLAEAKADRSARPGAGCGIRSADAGVGRSPPRSSPSPTRSADGHITVVPEVLVTGGGGGGASKASPPRSMRTLGSATVPMPPAQEESRWVPPAMTPRPASRC